MNAITTLPVNIYIVLPKIEIGILILQGRSSCLVEYILVLLTNKIETVKWMYYGRMVQLRLSTNYQVPSYCAEGLFSKETRQYPAQDLTCTW